MEIGRITGATRVLGKSQGYYGLPLRDEAKNLGDLPHMLLTLQNDTVTGPDTPTMVTAWLPNPDELAALAAGAPLYVSLVGTAHPPIMVSVGDAPPPLTLRERLDAISAERAKMKPGEYPEEMEVCPVCNGCGYDNPAQAISTCLRCNGSGGVPVE